MMPWKAAFAASIVFNYQSSVISMMQWKASMQAAFDKWLGVLIH